MEHVGITGLLINFTWILVRQMGRNAMHASTFITNQAGLETLQATVPPAYRLAN
jgi:hypothetical protein